MSLLGIRQFYQLVGDMAPDTSATSSSTTTTTNGTCNGTAGTAAASAAAGQEGAALQPPPPPPAQPAAGEAVAKTEAVSSSSTTSNAVNGLASPAEATTAQPPPPPLPQQQQAQGAAGTEPAEQPEPQLSIAEQQQLLMLKVDALLQLLSSVSFHQVGVACMFWGTCRGVQGLSQGWRPLSLPTARCSCSLQKPSALMPSPRSEAMCMLCCVLCRAGRGVLQQEALG